MKDIYEVIRTKEALVLQLTKELQALRIVAPMLDDTPTTGTAKVREPVERPSKNWP